MQINLDFPSLNWLENTEITALSTKTYSCISRFLTPTISLKIIFEKKLYSRKKTDPHTVTPIQNKTKKNCVSFLSTETSQGKKEKNKIKKKNVREKKTEKKAEREKRRKHKRRWVKSLCIWIKFKSQSLSHPLPSPPYLSFFWLFF